jgi:SAM-dependent methyltransferase
VLDISGPRARCSVQSAAAGHTVIQLLGQGAGAAAHTPDGAGDGALGKGQIHSVIADTGSLGFLADGSLDAVIAEDRVLSRHLVTEATVAEIARVLRPGGRMLLCVDSLVLGMAILAEQKHWAQLSDVPRAEVVLVPWPNGIITRCFWAEELRELLLDAGLETEWIRPRTILSPSTVEHVLAAAPRELSRLVRTELATPIGDESVGIHLVASAVKPAAAGGSGQR